MLAYAANMPRAAGRAGSPITLTLILAGHALLIGAVLTARMGIVTIGPERPPTVINIPNDPPPPKPAPQTDPEPRRPVTQPLFIEQEQPIIEMAQPTNLPIDIGPSIADIGAVIGSGPTTVIDPPRRETARSGPRLTTSEQALKPPYPLDMRRAEQEATLKLRLTIDARGRVVAVDPVGPANPSFLEAARRHILKVWRYRPATEDGAAVISSTVISLSFRLEDV